MAETHCRVRTNLGWFDFDHYASLDALRRAARGDLLAYDGFGPLLGPEALLEVAWDLHTTFQDLSEDEIRAFMVWADFLKLRPTREQFGQAYVGTWATLANYGEHVFRASLSSELHRDLALTLRGYVDWTRYALDQDALYLRLADGEIAVFRA